MRFLFCLPLIIAISSADVLWSWDFEEIPAGWEANQYWEFSDSGARSYVSASTSGPYSVTQTSEMLSDTLTIPAGLSQITVEITSEIDYDGWWTTGESSCYLWSRLGIVGGSLFTIEFDSHGWGFDEFTGEPVSAQVVIPVNGEDLVFLMFNTLASSDYGAYAMMDWLITDFTISGSGSHLDLYSWGEIKHSF